MFTLLLLLYFVRRQREQIRICSLRKWLIERLSNVNYCTVGTMHSSYEVAAAPSAYPAYPVSVENTPPESQSKSDGFFGWLPGSGIMHKVIEKTKVMAVL